MNNLEKIQKTMKVFQTLTKIVMGFSFVAIAFTLVVGSVSLMADKLPFGELLQRLLIEADRTIACSVKAWFWFSERLKLFVFVDILSWN